jgi:hypothetical protein
VTHFRQNILRQPAELQRTTDYLRGAGQHPLAVPARAVRKARHIHLSGIDSSSALQNHNNDFVFFKEGVVKKLKKWQRRPLQRRDQLSKFSRRSFLEIGATAAGASLAVRSRKPVVEDAVFGHHAALTRHMANESYFRKTVFLWDEAPNSIRG